jgi:hypothetical protein
MEVDDVKNNMLQNELLPTPAAVASVCVAWVRPRVAQIAFVSGAESRNQIDSKLSATAVRSAALPVGVMREKSVHLTVRPVATTLRNTQLNDYGFGTPVGVGAPRISVKTGVPPRSRPV